MVSFKKVNLGDLRYLVHLQEWYPKYADRKEGE